MSTTTYIVGNTFKSFGDPSPIECESFEEAERVDEEDVEEMHPGELMSYEGADRYDAKNEE